MKVTPITLKALPGTRNRVFTTAEDVGLLLRLERAGYEVVVVSGQVAVKERPGRRLTQDVVHAMRAHNKGLVRVVKYCNALLEHERCG